MTAVNTDESGKTISGFPPQASYLLENPSTRPLFTSVIIILKVYPVLVLILGSFGNVLSFCVLLRANMRRYSTFCYLACLALVDLGVITTFCTNFISLYHFNNDIQNEPFACNLFAFCIYFLPQYSSWILVAVSIDRVISAKYLRLAKTWSKPKHSVLVTLLLGIFLGVLNSHFFLYENNSSKQKDPQQMVQYNRTSTESFISSDMLVNPNPNGISSSNNYLNEGFIDSSSVSYELYTSSLIFHDAVLQQQHDNYLTISPESLPPIDINQIYCSLENSLKHEKLHNIWVWIDLLMNVFLPFTAMIGCTIIIILTLVRSSSRSGSTSVRRSRRRRNISVMLITINLVFISLTAPIVIFLSIHQYLKDSKNLHGQVVLILIKIFCIILMNLNHSVNIIVYSVTAKEFRSEMKNFLRAVLYCCIGSPTNSIDFAYAHDDGTITSRVRRLKINLFHCCRLTMNSNSTNTTDSGGLPHTPNTGMNTLSSKNDGKYGTKLNKRKQLDQNGKKQFSAVRYNETSAPHNAGQYLAVKPQSDPASSIFEQEDDLSLHGLSNLTEH